MSYLLDTHTLLWHVESNSLLSEPLSETIESLENEIYVSIASLWEIAIKINIGKMKIEEPLEDFILRIHHAKIQIIQIQTPHLIKLQSLPLHHRDPFDRLILAQSMIEGHQLISKDAVFDAYEITRVWS